MKTDLDKIINNASIATRRNIADNLTIWKNDNSSNLYYKNVNELLDEVIELIRKGDI
jgi:hypothetical protein